MDRDKVAQKFQELWSAVTEEHAQHQTLYVNQKETENQAIGRDRVQVAKVAQHDHERKMAGNYGVPTNPPPTPKTYTVWEALERTEKARDTLRGTINELNARLEGVLTPEDPTTQVGQPGPGGVGVAFRLGPNVASVEDAIYRLRGIINRLTL